MSRPRFTVHADCSITRRKRFLMVTDEAGQVRFRSRYMGDILEWMDAEGQAAYYLAIEGRQPSVICQALDEKKELETWQN